METKQQGVHIRKISSQSSQILVGADGLIPSAHFRTEIRQTSEPILLENPAAPTLGVILTPAGAEMDITGRVTHLQRWSWFYLPAGCRAKISPQRRALSLLFIQPAGCDSAQDDPVIAPIEALKVIRKEGRITYNAAGDGCAIDRPFFMASFCIYDLAYGSMPQHVHTDQEECMIVLRTTGSQPQFCFGNHSAVLQDEMLIHVFPGDYHGFRPSQDGKIAIIALYMVPSNNAGVKMEPMTSADIALWNDIAGA